MKAVCSDCGSTEEEHRKMGKQTEEGNEPPKKGYRWSLQQCMYVDNFNPICKNCGATRREHDVEDRRARLDNDPHWEERVALGRKYSPKKCPGFLISNSWREKPLSS
jgi:hypothetical protein